MAQRLSLRARLILGVVALAGVGLVAADVVTYTSLHSFLISRTDDFLDTAHSSAESALHGPGRGTRRQAAAAVRRLTGPDIGQLKAKVPGLFVQVRRANGTIVATGRRTAVPRHEAGAAAAPAEDDRARRRAAALTGSATSRSRRPTAAGATAFAPRSTRAATGTS